MWNENHRERQPQNINIFLERLYFGCFGQVLRNESVDIDKSIHVEHIRIDIIYTSRVYGERLFLLSVVTFG